MPHDIIVNIYFEMGNFVVNSLFSHKAPDVLTNYSVYFAHLLMTGTAQKKQNNLYIYRK